MAWRLPACARSWRVEAFFCPRGRHARRCSSVLLRGGVSAEPGAAPSDQNAISSVFPIS